ncbi:DEKNAAC102564 [Brettanomyces naardenensis]|uniref:DEKNAAC102564 n=1 Tax=Brettanomyces naardenensis TaxID=13370 RepID=A0A448YKN9_BRENA|nr:DEKNAAC102564 [Brettanomyces naardenensis]
MSAFSLADIDVYRIIQLVIIIGGYVVMRQRFVAYMKTRKLKQKLQKDKEQKAENLIDRPEDLASDPISTSERSWGWGKPTRKIVRRQQQLLEERLEETAGRQQGDVDSDEDIKELLID